MFFLKPCFFSPRWKAPEQLQVHSIGAQHQRVRSSHEPHHQPAEEERLRRVRLLRRQRVRAGGGRRYIKRYVSIFVF